MQRDGAEFFILRSAATGRYLALSPPPSRRAVQRDDGEPDHRFFLWRAFMEGEGAVLRNAFHNSKLRASGFHHSKNNGVTAGNKDGRATANWLVEAAMLSARSPGKFVIRCVPPGGSKFLETLLQRFNLSLLQFAFSRAIL